MKQLLVAAVLAASCSSALADSVDSAFALCRVMDSTGLTSSPCQVSGWNSSVTAVIDMNSGEARKLCPQIAATMRAKGLTFDSGWRLEIKSPYSGDNTIAFCNL